MKYQRALAAGFIAITANTLFLEAAPLLHIQAANGGLLKLVLKTGRPFLGQAAFYKTITFRLLFHYLTGFLMAWAYVQWFCPFVKAPGWLKGSLFSLLPWLINGLIVLPLLEQGVFGIRQLSYFGIVYFFAANALFGLILGWLNNRKDC